MPTLKYFSVGERQIVRVCSEIFPLSRRVWRESAAYGSLCLMRRDSTQSDKFIDGIFTILPFDRFPLEEMERRAKSAVPPGGLRSAGKSAERYLSHLAGRAAVACLFAELKLDCVVLPNEEFGYLQTFERQTKTPRHDVCVNVTHTRGVAAAVILSRPVGIDIERSERSVQRVLERMATPEEVSSLPSSIKVEKGSVPGGILLWSAKEAVSKAVGLGIKFGLNNFVLDLNSPPPFPVTLGVTGPLSLKDPVVYAQRWREFILTICSERSALLPGLKEIFV